MKPKLLGLALLTIAGFAIADLTRAATAALTSFLASTAVPQPTPLASTQTPPTPLKVQRASFTAVGEN